jgi:hypothetical protein
MTGRPARRAPRARIISGLIVASGLAVACSQRVITGERSHASAAELNHLYVTLRQDTIDAIAGSPFLAERFAMLERETTTTSGASWTGTYLIGWRAYLELFGPGGAEDLVEGSSGIGFSTRRTGDGSAIGEKLRSIEGDEARTDIMTRIVGEESVPWFAHIRLRSLDRRAFSVWLMDFRPEYLQRKKMALAPDGGFDRHGYNAAAYATTERMRAYEARLFDDLLEVHIELGPAERLPFDRFAKALGFVGNGRGAVRVYRAGDAALVVTERPDARYRIRKVVCSLRSAVDPPAEHVFGPDARLIVRGRRAIWSFGPD